jgi:uncharacterized protein (AIM24 family)
MLRASGEGRYVISREGRCFTALELGDEPAYFREEVLYAFEESILFENGRVPSKAGTDLHLVHLRGRGRLLLVTSGVPQAVEVQRGEPLRIPMDQLVGWHGALIQPRLVSIVEEAPEMGVALELAGEGRALIDVPAAPVMLAPPDGAASLAAAGSGGPPGSLAAHFSAAAPGPAGPPTSAASAASSSSPASPARR